MGIIFSSFVIKSNTKSCKVLLSSPPTLVFSLFFAEVSTTFIVFTLAEGLVVKALVIFEEPLEEEEFDAAFRVGPLADSSFVARGLGKAHLYICASPEYLRLNGVPRTPQDLHDHAIVRHPVEVWELQGSDGVELLELKSRMVVNDMSLIKSLLTRGMGIGIVPGALGEAEFTSGALVPLLLDFPLTEKEMYLIYPSRKQPPSKLVSFIEFVMERCRPDAPWSKDIEFANIP